MAARIRVGIVGATVTPGGSGWGANAHVPALQALPEYELKAVCTAHEATARASAEKYGAALAFHSMDDMVKHPDIDLVVGCVRVPGHHDLVMKSLRAGKATFCEWPLVATLRQAEEMAGLAREKSLRRIVGLQAHSDDPIQSTVTASRSHLTVRGADPGRGQSADPRAEPTHRQERQGGRDGPRGAGPPQYGASRHGGRQT